MQQVYDAVAKEWHGTRYKAWPRVVDFVRALPSNALVADLGCGNGKLAPSCKECGHFAVGCDFSAALVRIAVLEMGMQATRPAFRPSTRHARLDLDALRCRRRWRTP